MPTPTAIRVVLFDIGGVLVEPSGVATMLTWMDHRVSADELWKMWLTSPNVRRFETGRLPADEFAERVITEFQLPIACSKFLHEMTRWSVTLFPGAVELIERIPPHYIRATLCNSNPIHWGGLMQNTRLISAFGHHFASHLIGKIKPDAEAFQHVSEALACEPQGVLFLDDNALNVTAANAVGMKALRVQGVLEAERALVDSSILTGLQSIDPHITH